MSNHIGSSNNLTNSVSLVNLSASQVETFWNKIAKTEPNNCWPWLAHKDRNGYGELSIKQKVLRAHRVAWILTNGNIPDGLHVLHNCPNGDNPACCNPSHLWLGTHQQNMADCKLKGRYRKGPRHPFAKLDEEKVKQIRKLKDAGQTYANIAKLYGVNEHTIYSVVIREWWAHVP